MSETREFAAEAAQIEANVARVVALTADWARHMAARFNGAVYLVGSMLHNPSPRDCDFRIVVHDHEFAARYGMDLKHAEFNEFHPLYKRRGLTAGKVVPFDDGVTQRWVDDVAKLTGCLSVKLGLNVDVKVWPDSYWHVPYPKPVLLAEPSARWFICNAYCPDPAAPPAVPVPEERGEHG